MVSLVGTPGVGKTRLMLEVACETASFFEGVAFAWVADVRDAWRGLGGGRSPGARRAGIGSPLGDGSGAHP